MSVSSCTNSFLLTLAALLFLVFVIYNSFLHENNKNIITPIIQERPLWSFQLLGAEEDKADDIKKRTSLEILEEDLARSRAAIREAVRWENYTSSKKENFVPRGSIYRNPYAFHQSHIEMLKKFKVWTYREGDHPLVHHGPLKGIYAIEGQFIHEMESSPLRPFMASHPDEAHAFFIPISVANIVKYVYGPLTTYSREQLQRLVEDYVNIISNKYPYWNRSNGADHFILSCHDWGPDISTGNPELFKNVIRVLCNANISEGFQPKRDVSLAEVYGPSKNLASPDAGVDPRKRPILAFFAGGAHGIIRLKLVEHWKDKDKDIQVHQYLPEGQNYTKLMSQSKFCLCPSGFEVASARVVEAIYSGCIPVIIKENYLLPFSDVLNWSEFSVNVPVDEIRNLKDILQGIPEGKYLRMQKRVRRLQRNFRLNRPAQPYDIIHMVLHSVWLRRLNLRLPT